MNNKYIILIVALHFSNILMSMEITPNPTMPSQSWYLNKIFPHDKPVFSAYFDGQRLVTASDDCTARIFDTHTQQEVACFEYDIYYVSDLYLNSKEKDVMSCRGGGERILTQKVPNSQIQKEIDSILFNVNQHRLKHTQKKYFLYHKMKNFGSSEEYCNVYIEDISTKTVLGSLRHDKYVWDKTLDPSENYITTASADGIVRIFKRHDKK